MPQDIQKEKKQIHVEMWSDLICPWCGIGEKRFFQAMAKFSERNRVTFSLRSYRIMPGSKAIPVEQVLRDKYGLSSTEIVDTIAKIETLAKEVGLQYHLSGSWGGDTLDGHRLIKMAKQFGKDHALYRNLFNAAMSEKRSVLDHALLRLEALEVGLDIEHIEDVLEGDAFGDEVEEDEVAMKILGGRGVPFFVINKRHVYPGALSTDVFLNALHKALEDETDDVLIKK